MKNWLEKIQLRVSRFMYGRNGRDELSQAAYIAGLVLYLLAFITRTGYLITISFLAFCYGLFRMFSKNIGKRQKENRAFCERMRMPRKYINLLKKKREYKDTHKCFMCRKCGQIIRVPKGKKKVEIICPRCSRRFIRRT